MENVWQEAGGPSNGQTTTAHIGNPHQGLAPSRLASLFRRGLKVSHRVTSTLVPILKG